MHEPAGLADITCTDNGHVDVAQLHALYRDIGWDHHNRRTEAETTAMLRVSHYYIAAHTAEGTSRGERAMKLRTGDPWMPAPDYGRSLRGLTINLLVRDIAAALPFHREVLGAEVVYSDPDFAVLRYGEVEWMLHADHTYLAHPLHARLTAALPRGTGAELRLHGRDPDAAEAAARRLGCTVLVATTDKPHGLREVYLLDTDGYLWVPDVPRPR